jgi:paraquat-inducible protein B
MVRRILTVLMLALLLWACKEDALHIKVRYDHIQGLQEGDRVLFQQNHIGAVTGVFYSVDGDYLVDVSIKRHFANAATEDSKFFIIGDPENMGKKAVKVVQTKTAGAPLQDHSIVEGSTRSSPAFGQMSEGLERGLEGFNKQFEQFFDDLRSLPESEEFKKLERELERLAEEMKQASGLAKKEIEKEVLPRLKEEIEKLRERLEKLGREKEVEPLETKMEEMRKM